MSSLTLYRIEADLQELATLRDEAEDEGNCEALKVIDAQIRAYLTSEVSKVDSYAGLIHRMEADAQASENEEQRFAIRAKRLRANVERLKANALAVMQQFGVRELSTPINTLRPHTNGSLQALDVPVVNALPIKYRIITVTMPEAAWRKLVAGVTAPLPLSKNPALSADNDAIRKALSKHVACPQCAGSGEPFGPEEDGKCPVCEGKGTVPATIPGARLLPRGEHLRLS